MIHLDLNSFNNDRIFLELRFKDSFKLPISDTKYKILDRFSKKYPIYNTENPEHITLINPERQEQVHIQLNRLLFTWDKPKTIPDFVKSAQSDCNFILKILEVENISRIGFRTHNSFQGGNQSAITEFIFQNFMTSKFKTGKFADQYFNPLVQFSGKKGTLFFNLGLTYSQEQILEHTMGQQPTSRVRDLLMVDLDTYKENVKVNKLQNFFLDAQEINFKLPDYILSIKE